MDYCGPLGIPHSEFLKWAHADQDKAIAHKLFRGMQCNKCGTNSEEWLDDEGKDIEPPPYEAGTRYCPGCATLEDARKQIPKDRKSVVDVFLKRSGGRSVRRTGVSSP